jgi:hypothetical protein
MEHFLSRASNVWACTYFIIFHCGSHSLKVLHKKMMFISLGVHYVKKDLKKLMDQKEKMYYPPQCSPYAFFLAKLFFYMCFDNLIKYYAPHHYYIT